MGSKPMNFPYLNFRNFRFLFSLHENSGGGKQNRTADLLHAMQALYQLSYTPSPANFRASYYSPKFMRFSGALMLRL